MFKRIDHVELTPSNTAKTLAFYTEILGFKIKNQIPINAPPMKEVIYLQLGDTVIEIISVEGPMEQSNAPWQIGYRALALEVDNMAAAVECLKSHGVNIHRAPVNLGDSYRAEILDPDGLIIELRQWLRKQ